MEWCDLIGRQKLSPAAGMRMVLNDLRAHAFATPFNQPVLPHEAPDYHTVVKVRDNLDWYSQIV